MDEQSGESEEVEVMGEGIGESEMDKVVHVDEKIEGVDSRDMVKHSGRSDQLFLERMMMKVADQE